MEQCHNTEHCHAGRVGTSRDCIYRSNDHFREAIALQEAKDIAVLEEKLDRQLTKEEQAHIGVSRLRLFLEQLLQRQYMDSVPSIVALLDREYRTTSLKLHQIVHELSNLDHVKLKERGRIFRDSFLSKLSLLLRGTVVAPVDKFGESLQDERVHAGAFVAMDGVQMPYKHMPNANMRLYGGAQYHRAMAEFRFVVGNVKCPVISREEIVNACGVEDIHDGTNYFRTWASIGFNHVPWLKMVVSRKIVNSPFRVLRGRWELNQNSMRDSSCESKGCF